MKYCVLFILILLVQACGSCRSGEGDRQGPSVAPEAVSNIPFLTKEPETYQASIVSEAYSEGAKVNSRQILIARRGNEYSVTFDVDSPESRRLIDLNDGTRIIADWRTSTYTSSRVGPAESGLARDLTRGWLAMSPGTRYEKLETSDGVTKYKVSPVGAEGSETFVFYDEKRRIPVRTEIFSGTAGSRRLAYRYEVRDLATRVDDKLFDAPEGMKLRGSQD